MNTDVFAELTLLGLLRVEGFDAKKFLQGQLTCHLDEVNQSEARLGAHCNPQGRMLSLFKIFLYQDNYFLMMPRELIPIAITHLKKYAVFFKVKLTDASESYCLFAATQKSTSDVFSVYTFHTYFYLISDITLKSQCKNFLAKSYHEVTENIFKQKDIAANIPALYPETSEKLLPHEINLPGLNGVSFAKGCFTGQEIVARMQYRGKLKTHLYQAKSTMKPLLGQTLYSERDLAGQIVDFVEIGYNSYHLLFTANENEIAENFYLDIDKKFRLEILK